MQKSTKKPSSKKPSQKAKPAIDRRARPEDYQVVLEWSDDDACYIATMPAWNGVRTHGRTLAEASRNAHEVLEMLLESARALGQPIPEAQRSYSGKLQLRLPTSLHRRLAREAEREGVSLNHWLTAKLAG